MEQLNEICCKEHLSISVQEDLMRRMEVKFAKRLEDQTHVLKEEMKAEIIFLENKLRAEITLAEDAMRSAMEKEIRAVKKSLGIK